jgi:hypothetical protein
MEIAKNTWFKARGGSSGNGKIPDALANPIVLVF